MDVALILFVGGVVVVAWIFFWTRLNRETPLSPEVEQVLNEVPLTSAGDAVLVSREHGQLVYVNGSARQLLGMNGGEPSLEQVARLAKPTDSFLGLFAGEAQSAFQLGTRWVEASSHRIPTGGETRTVVVLRELNGGTTSQPDALDLSTAMSLINQIGDTINASLGIEQTLQTLLTIIRQSISFDAGEINLRDEKTGAFIPRGWAGDSTYLISLAEAGGVYQPEEGMTGWIARHREPMMLGSRDKVAIRPKVKNNPYRSLMGVPLILGDHLVGTLELGALNADHFSQGDYALLQAISKPVCVAIYNASLYAEQIRRIEDISTLQQVVEQEMDAIPADGAASASIFGLLTKRVASLAGAEMCGIFLYDAARNGLVPALPFFGLQEAIIRNTFINLQTDSPQRDIWERQPYWISNDVRDEPMVDALGLQSVVNLGNIQNTAWMPMQIGGERIGVLTVSNRAGGSFTPRDIANLRALAAQASIVVENVQLARRGQNLDAQLEGLKELTNAISVLTDQTEFYTELTQRIARLMDIETCGILLYDEDHKRLVSHLPFYGVADVDVHDYQINLTPGTVFDELWSDEEFWYTNRVQVDTLTFAAGLDQLAVKLNIQKTLFAVLSTAGRKLGVVQASNKKSGEDFNDSDARLLLIFATQAAAIIENARLFQEVQHRSEQAQRLRHIAEIAGTIGTSDEGLRDLLGEISHAMSSPVVFINVLHQAGSLVTYPQWVFGYDLSDPITQDTYAPDFEYSVVRSWRPFLSNDVKNDKR
ncbi:MAG TPA: GAF domain-containing protein, partial [Phototrophicaceae bacterium]|nr:GAF domain-containing protein [Phototrophicaceae bacterium]